MRYDIIGSTAATSVNAHLATYSCMPSPIGTQRIREQGSRHPGTPTRRKRSNCTFAILQQLSCFALITAICLGHTDSADAAVFKNSAKWPQEADGYAYIRICVRRESSTDQRRGASIHVTTPSLNTVVRKVRDAIHRTWETHAKVQFIDWRECGQLSSAQRQEAVGLYIHPSAPNNAALGKGGKGDNDLSFYEDSSGDTVKDYATGKKVKESGINFKPWGGAGAGRSRSPRCINYVAGLARSTYRFNCVEQYAIHEFGHVLGLVHEWESPATPSTCSSRNPVTDYSTFWTTTKKYTVASRYDYDSIMTYTNGCAHVTGERFGSTRPSQTDIDVVKKAYPYVGSKHFARMPETGDIISLRSDTGRWMGRCRGCAPSAVASRFRDTVAVHVKGRAADLPAYAKFKVRSVGGGKITLRSVDTGAYVSRCRGCFKSARHPDALTIHATKDTAGHVQFKVEIVGSKIALQADTGRYVGRCRDCQKHGTKIDSAFIDGAFAKGQQKWLPYMWLVHTH